MVPPTYFDVIDCKNLYMNPDTIVDRGKAQKQWKVLVDTLVSLDIKVYIIDAVEGLEDMVFAANPILAGTGSDGSPVYIISRMKHKSRQREIAHFEKFIDSKLNVDSSNGRLKGNGVFSFSELFEGGGDGVWHLGKKQLWLGYGYRTGSTAFKALSKLFHCPVIPMKLKSESFYHLDTCFMVLDSETVFYVPDAFDSSDSTTSGSSISPSIDIIESHFKNAIAIPSNEAQSSFCCNGISIPSKKTLLLPKWQKEGATEGEMIGTIPLWMKKNKPQWNIKFLDASEFQKSGGSLYCMKQWLFRYSDSDLNFNN